jgi:nucleoside-diphosphate-sugar epimerase
VRVLLTGHNGYIGSVLGPFLARFGHQVVGIDVGYFAETDFFEERDRTDFMRIDIRDLC